MANRLKKIQQNSLRDQVITAIRDAIIKGDFKPGEKIHEHALAEQLGVSRTPIREAMGILEQQGLVRIFPKRGTFVAHEDAKELRDKLCIRSAMEQLAFRQAIERLNSDQWSELCENLRHIIYDMEEAVKKEDFVAANETDMNWHTALVDAAQNQYLSRFWRVLGLQDLVWSPERGLYPFTPEAYSEMLYSRHKKLLDILLGRDVEECCQAIDRHIMIKFVDIPDLSSDGAHG
jgi:DNA-binding GntR family transcriptional regulator